MMLHDFKRKRPFVAKSNHCPVNMINESELGQVWILFKESSLIRIKALDLKTSNLDNLIKKPSLCLFKVA